MVVGCDNNTPGTAYGAVVEAGEICCMPTDEAVDILFVRSLFWEAVAVFKRIGLSVTGGLVADILPSAYAAPLVQLGILQVDIGTCRHGYFGGFRLCHHAEKLGYGNCSKNAHDDDDHHDFDEGETVLFIHDRLF